MGAMRPAAGSVRPIRQYGDPILRQHCAPVIDFDDSVASLVADLTRTCQEPGRAGLAAPQIGVGRRVFVYNVDGVEGYLINPEIVLAVGEQDGEEGCLSMPGLWMPVIRAAQVVARGVDLDGKPVEIGGLGMLSRCLQHEIAHLDGGLCLDETDPASRRKVLAALRRRDIADG